MVNGCKAKHRTCKRTAIPAYACQLVWILAILPILAGCASSPQISTAKTAALVITGSPAAVVTPEAHSTRPAATPASTLNATATALPESRQPAGNLDSATGPSTVNPVVVRRPTETPQALAS